MFFVIRISKYVGCEGTIIDAKKSAMGGQSRHFDGAPITSGLPR
jgi:hypothetical protein